LTVDIGGNVFDKTVDFNTINTSRTPTNLSGGVIHSIKIDDNNVYVGGLFSTFKGNSQTNFGVFNKTTLNQVSSTSIIGTIVYSVSIDTNNIYVGGQIDDYFKVISKSNLTTTLSGYPTFDGNVYDIINTNDMIYIAGGGAGVNGFRMIDKTDTSVFVDNYYKVNTIIHSLSYSDGKLYMINFGEPKWLTDKKFEFNLPETMLNLNNSDGVKFRLVATNDPTIPNNTYPICNNYSYLNYNIYKCDKSEWYKRIELSATPFNGTKETWISQQNKFIVNIPGSLSFLKFPFDGTYHLDFYFDVVELVDGSPANTGLSQKLIVRREEGESNLTIDSSPIFNISGVTGANDDYKFLNTSLQGSCLLKLYECDDLVFEIVLPNNTTMQGFGVNVTKSYTGYVHIHYISNNLTDRNFKRCNFDT
jgi:hypothetical protein